DFPRTEPVSNGGVEWLTVRPATGAIEAPFTDHGRPAPAPAVTGVIGRVEPVRVWDIRRMHAVDWERIPHDGRFVPARTVIEREGPVVRTRWEGGPFPYPVEPPPYVEEHHLGTVTVRSSEGRTHVVYGPWQVIIRGVGARAERRILAVWEVYRSWVA